MDMDRYIGKLLDDRYEILEVIGSGGMSVVYKARCHRLNRLVAIKILKDENLQDEDFRRRFHAESQAVAMLSHPNIVSVYDVSTTDDTDYIVMELIDGITLKQYMEKKGVLNWKETLHFAIQIAKALEHAHGRGLVHRDIKPHNVMVLKNGSVKVADFGIARIMSQSNTLTKEALGSVHYISPEQAKGGRVDNRSDLYSLGVVMYEMITGRPPYDGESPVAVAIQHINGGASRPSTLNPNVPKGLEQIIMKAMARDLRKRYPNATAMLYDMDEFRKDPDMVFHSEQPVSDPAAATRKVSEIPEQGIEKISVPERRTDVPERRTRKRTKEEPNRGNVATIAIVVCSVVAMIAIVVFLMIMVGNQPNDQPTTVTIPDLVSQVYEQLPAYDGIEVVKQNSEYSKEYPAGQIMRQQPLEGEKKPYGTKVFVTVSLGAEPEPVRMPSVTGEEEADAKAAILATGLDLYVQVESANSNTVAVGAVISSDPAAGTVLKNGQTIVLTVSTGPRVVTAEMPDLLKNGGWDKATAEGMMERRGFRNVIWVPVDSYLVADKVVSQSVPAGEVIDVNTEIIVEYSSGKAPEGGEGTEPPVSDGPEPTEPTEPQTVTIEYTLTGLPKREKDYTVSIMMDGKAVVVAREVKAGQTTLTVELTGKGTQECAVYIDGDYYETVEVEFKADEE